MQHKKRNTVIISPYFNQIAAPTENPEDAEWGIREAARDRYIQERLGKRARFDYRRMSGTRGTNLYWGDLGRPPRIMHPFALRRQGLRCLPQAFQPQVCVETICIKLQLRGCGISRVWKPQVLANARHIKIHGGKILENEKKALGSTDQ